MFERNVFDEYKLYCEQRFMLGEFEGFTAQNKHYFFVSVDHLEDDEIKEMIQMGNHLKANGDHEVADFIPTEKNALSAFIDGQYCVLFQFPTHVSRKKKEASIGYELARHHKRGKTYLKEKKEDPLWSKFWIHRLTQLDMLYESLTKKEKKTSFDKAFMISFPYYLGRTENAIQYIVDSDIDFGQQFKNEIKTICHYKFSPKTWLTIDENTGAAVKSPTEFLYDHPSRDVAEWMRSLSQQEEKSFTAIQSFLADYESVEAISPLSWRYIYGRLMFPIEYFQIVEGHYRSVNDDEIDHYTEQLFDLFYREEANEDFLRKFHSKVLPDSLRPYIPEVDWLKSPVYKKKMLKKQ